MVYTLAKKHPFPCYIARASVFPGRKHDLEYLRSNGRERHVRKGDIKTWPSLEAIVRHLYSDRSPQDWVIIYLHLDAKQREQVSACWASDLATLHVWLTSGG